MVTVVKHSWLCDSWARFLLYNLDIFLLYFHYETPVEIRICAQWQSQDFSLEEAKLKDNIKNEINLKVLINNNNKINKQM